MLLKYYGTVIHGAPDSMKANPARKPFEVDDEEGFRHVLAGVAEPHGDKAAKRIAQMREQQARERIRLAEQWRGDEEQEDVPVEDRASAAEGAEALLDAQTRERANVLGRQQAAKADQKK